MHCKLTLKSSNRKTGPIPVSVTESTSCPNSCPLKDSGICYAKNGPSRFTWAKVNQHIWGSSWSEFCDQIADLPAGQVWRHNEAGDLPHHDQQIDQQKLQQLTAANSGKRGFTYTHHDMTSEANRSAVAAANSAGFTINLSADSLAEADQLVSLQIAPVAVILPADQLTPVKTPAGNHVAICPHSIDSSIQCVSCQLCTKPNRKAIIGFPAHGTGRNKLNTIAA